MKKIILLSFLFLPLCLSAQNLTQNSTQNSAQSNSNFSTEYKATVDSLQEKIDNLESRLADKNYTRVPNNEFDKSLENIVSQRVSGSILYWIGGLGAILAFAGFSLINSMKNTLKNDADKIVKENSENAEKALKEMKNEIFNEIKYQNERLVNENKRQDEGIKSLNEQVKLNLEALDKYKVDTINSIDEKFKSALESIWDDIADSKYNRAKENNFKGEVLINEVKSFLENKSISISKSKTILLVDALMRCYYSEAKYKDMIQLLREYEDKYELLPETYASAAIALNDSYKRTGSDSELKTCIECCDKSIETLKNYGTPYAVKLEVLMMSYEKAFNDNEKSLILEKIKRTFKDIENNESIALPYEVIERINIDRPINYIRDSILQLEKLFKNEFLNMEQRVCNVILTNESHMKNSSFMKFVTTILQKNADEVQEIQGKWKAVKIIHSGNELTGAEADFNIAIEKFSFEQNSSGEKLKADVLLLPYDNMNNGINLYYHNNTEKYVSGIYSVENDVLKFCLNNNSEMRPENFVSNEENKFSLITFEKFT